MRWPVAAVPTAGAAGGKGWGCPTGGGSHASGLGSRGGGWAEGLREDPPLETAKWPPQEGQRVRHMEGPPG